MKTSISEHWAVLDRHFKHHATLVDRFRSADRLAVMRMWESQSNEVGEALSQVEREVLIERHCELFGAWPGQGPASSSGSRAIRPLSNREMEVPVTELRAELDIMLTRLAYTQVVIAKSLKAAGEALDALRDNSLARGWYQRLLKNSPSRCFSARQRSVFTLTQPDRGPER